MVVAGPGFKWQASLSLRREEKALLSNLPLLAAGRCCKQGPGVSAGKGEGLSHRSVRQESAHCFPPFEGGSGKVASAGSLAGRVLLPCRSPVPLLFFQKCDMLLHSFTHKPSQEIRSEREQAECVVRRPAVSLFGNAHVGYDDDDQEAHYQPEPLHEFVV